MGRTSLIFLILALIVVFTVTLAENVWSLLSAPLWIHHDGRVELRFPEPVSGIATLSAIGEEDTATVLTFEGMRAISLPASDRISYRANGKSAYSSSMVLDGLEEFTFVVYGDSRHFEERHRKVFEAFSEENADFVVHLGDIVDSGLLFDQWRVFFEITSEYWYSHVIYTVRGNHEYPFDVYDELLYPPYYAFKRDGMLFLVLDTNRSLDEGSSQWIWLLDELEKARESKERVVVFTHHPIYTKGPHRKDTIVKKLQKSLAPLFERYGVKLVFSAHDHNYQHLFKDGVHYVVTGGGGAGLYEVDANADSEARLLAYAVKLHYVVVEVSENRMKVTAKTPLGETIEEFYVSF